MLRRARTHSVSVERPPGEVYAFLADVQNWPRWAVLTVRSVRSNPEGWVLEGVEGDRSLIFTGNPELGLLDHELAGFSVAMRVIANGSGSEVIATYLQPEGMEEREFEQAANVRERELEAIKLVLERA